jgi:hypothetical protein
VWQHPQRKYAALHEGTFSVLGNWNRELFSTHDAVKDWLTVPPDNLI